jgi:hypothetical protein
LDQVRCPRNRQGPDGLSRTEKAKALRSDGLRWQSAGRRQKARRSSRSQTSASVSGAVLVNILTLERWRLAQTTTVAIACTAGVYAFLFSGLSGREGTRGKIGVARLERSNAQRQKHCKEGADDGKRPLAACHGSTPSRPKGASSKRHRESCI